MQRIQRALEVYAVSGSTMTALYAQQQQSALPYRLLKIALVPSDRKVLHARIETRFKQMLAAGFIDEVKALLLQYPSLHADSTSMRCVGYRQALAYLNGEYDEQTLQDKGVFATRQLAKRQLTWLRGMENTLSLDCLSETLFNEALININQFIKINS